MKYISKKHEITAFRFEKGVVMPEWFELARERKLVSRTIGYKKENYITIYNSDGGYAKAYFGDWICINEHETIFKLTHDEFNTCFALKGLS